jgi:pimeloyl-ACP methyl ester carboxylesterase
MTTDHGVRLRDGRSLSYAQYGDPAGFPIVSAHGGLACRLDVESAASVAAQSGVRLISPDRPGVGGSDPRPGRTILDWVSDVGELLDLLAIDRFAAMGWSLGGQYAASLGYAWSRRVTRLAIIAGALPLTEPGMFRELPTIDRASIRLSERAPWLARGGRRTATVRPTGRPRPRPSRRRRLADRGLRQVREHVAGSSATTTGRGRGVPGHEQAMGIRARGSQHPRGRVGGTR